ncbi:MAG: DUF1488 domain-containing protein [Hyphomicrobium sp.]|jgi:hypothetical protein|uniref:DUF1488 domain-containing protein n=1 Tax=Hyphomicrobium sp. TaxID=82 RepID=UPI0025BCCED2|nr:DUF1488 domain-containing protein [Hyphomicrobium sp.]MBX9863183.1 DUF1488 domain-containing protein [Hyphomicrobium sp.]
MTLTFPNLSRSYDERGRRVRFWGYDGTFEINFFVEQRAFSRIDPSTKLDEAGFLNTFDRYRDRILKVASNAYSDRHRDAYTLVVADF